MIAQPLTRISWFSRLLPATCRSFFAPCAALGAGALTLFILPGLKLALFAGAAARLASQFLGPPIVRVEQGWLLPSHREPVLVSGACSGSDFWLIVASLLAWHLTLRGKSTASAIVTALLCAAPFSIAVNSVRIIAVVQAHHWFIRLWPENYGPFFHQLTGVAVFLPSLIFLHALLEHFRSQRASRET